MNKLLLASASLYIALCTSAYANEVNVGITLGSPAPVIAAPAPVVMAPAPVIVEQPEPVFVERPGYDPNHHDKRYWAAHDAHERWVHQHNEHMRAEREKHGHEHHEREEHHDHDDHHDHYDDHR